MMLKKLKEILIHESALKWLCLGFAALAVGSFLFLTTEVKEASEGHPELIGSLDYNIPNWLFQIRSEELTSFAFQITALGSGIILTIVVICVVTALLFLKRIYSSLQLIIAALGAAAITHIAKIYFERPRPTTLSLISEVDGYSYPSGHSVSSAAIYFTIAFLVSQALTSRIQIALVWVFASALVAAIGLSRIYLGVHYFSDILAGSLIGVGWAFGLSGLRATLAK